MVFVAHQTVLKDKACVSCLFWFQNVASENFFSAQFHAPECSLQKVQDVGPYFYFKDSISSHIFQTRRDIDFPLLKYPKWKEITYFDLWSLHVWMKKRNIYKFKYLIAEKRIQQKIIEKKVRSTPSGLINELIFPIFHIHLYIFVDFSIYSIRRITNGWYEIHNVWFRWSSTG